MMTDSYKFFSFVPELILLVAFIAGWILFAGKDMYLFFRRFGVRHRLNKLPSDKKNTVFEFLGNLASSAFGKDIRGESAAAAELGLICISLLFSLRVFSFGTSCLIAGMTGAMPLIYLFARLQASRNKGSREGISFVSELNRQYRMHNRNIYDALACCCESADTYPICGKQAYKLLVHLQSASGQTEIRASIRQFSFALGTLWGNMLACNLRVCVEKGTDISEGLADIVQQLEKANVRAEERRRLNSESVRMTVFLVPVLYFGTLLLSEKYLGISVKELLRHQFFTAEGFLFFLIILFLFCLNLCCISLVSNTRLDF